MSSSSQVLTSQRFRANATLNRCVLSGYRMMAGERDSDAVTRLQLALFDLGYLQADGVDGIWGRRTNEAIVAFKTDEGLAPKDPVASSGTVGQLDAYFAWEPDSPDKPDATIVGLVELAEDSAARAAHYAEHAARVVDSLSWGGPSASPSEDPVRSALVAHLGVDVASAELAQRRRLVSRLTSVVGLLSRAGGGVRVVALDRRAWSDAVSARYYWPARTNPDETIVVTPPFRNALSDADRVGVLLRMAAEFADPGVGILGYPGTARYASLKASERTNNSVGMAAAVLFIGAGIADNVRPQPIWD